MGETEFLKSNWELFSTTTYKALKMWLTIAFCVAAERWISIDEIFEENR